MTPYKVLGTNCEQGFLEFNHNCDTLAKMQYCDGLMRTFSDDTIEVFMTRKTKQFVAKQMGGELDEHYNPKGELKLNSAEFEKNWRARLEQVR